MAGWEIKTVPYAFPVQALWSLWFHAGHVHREVHFFIVIFVGAAHFFPPARSEAEASLIPARLSQDALTNTPTKQKLSLNSQSAIKREFTCMF